MADDAAALERLTELDRRLVATVKGIKLLGAVSWPASTQVQFVEGWRRGNPALPQVEYAHTDFAQTRSELGEILAAPIPRTRSATTCIGRRSRG